MMKSIIAALALALAVAGVAAASRTDPATDPGACRLATVGGIAITDADAAELVGLLSPPPSPEEAGRLAVDAALAQWIVRGYVAPASASRRLASYRELLAKIGPHAPDRSTFARTAVAYLALAAERVGVEPGPCLVRADLPVGPLPAVLATDLATLAATPGSIVRRLSERARGRPILDGTAWRIWPSPARIELGPVLADELEPELSAALDATAPGAAATVTTKSGRYVLQRSAR
jgi:hypothetical protein